MMSRMTFRGWAIVASAVVITVGLSGCSDSEPPDADDARQATTMPPGSTAASSPASATDCAAIAFEENSDNIASEIRVEGADCDEARALVTRLAGEHSFASGPRSFTVGDYDCTVELDESDALPAGHYTCTASGVTVSWEKT